MTESPAPAPRDDTAREALARLVAEFDAEAQVTGGPWQAAMQYATQRASRVLALLPTMAARPPGTASQHIFPCAGPGCVRCGDDVHEPALAAGPPDTATDGFCTCDGPGSDVSGTCGRRSHRPAPAPPGGDDTETFTRVPMRPTPREAREATPKVRVLSRDEGNAYYLVTPALVSKATGLRARLAAALGRVEALCAQAEPRHDQYEFAQTILRAALADAGTDEGQGQS